ncbi:MAG TPA: epoxide hydrolase [Gammaproteobacteria bacterium]|jgi:microsomal epoxide hydrolase|nr:epoxide hydrolase [Arenicellales bacterium]MDP7064436.1 epoxide hydrolase [Arenicellales bacterium]HCX88573.1 epoxide hydrolase [Gammaproteobacteria bacterium]|tara:strand:+ start:680 stop:1825 length:1146 start_codon:yes stop_codon:yes gene_type:complete
MTTVKPFKVRISDEKIDAIRTRVAAFPWHEMPDDGGWDYGTNLDYMKEFCNYWVTEFDWRKQETRINRFSHFTAPVDGVDIHFIHEKGSGPNPRPLIISHGWPGTIVEFLDFIDLLAHPEHHGGTVDDAFDVVAPSLPGFGFSGRPPRPYGPRKMAAMFNSLMTDVLGHDRYIAQGGDWGGAISSWLGYDHAPSCAAIHINILTMRHKDGPQGAEEIAWAEQFEKDQIVQNGYRTQQATKPQTLSYAMMDSPVGVAAWILEKMHGWSDLTQGDLESVYTKDQLLTNIMVYIVSRTFNTASWIYYGRREEGGRILSAEGKRVEVPTGCALFPEELLAWPPRSYVDRIYNVTQWTEMPRGGHFAAMEQPDLLIKEIRKFARSL